MAELTVVISRHPDGSKVHRDMENALAARLAQSAGVLLVPHLYYLPPTHAIFSRLADLEGNIAVGAWLQSRATKWLLSARGINGDGREILCVNLADHSSAESCVEEFPRYAGTDGCCADGCEGSLPDDLSAEVTRRWYPVLDYSRCTNCGQCRNFCLFGVYSISPEGEIRVENPDNCKPNCPACARICPEVAVIFPEYKAGPINGSDIVDESELGRERIKVDIAAAVGPDVYAALRKRMKSGLPRFSAEMDELQAIAERRQCVCLAKLSEQYGIAPEALLSSPFADEVRAKLCSCCFSEEGMAGAAACDCDCECGCEC
ncbi:MAG: hypothetical protein QGD94_03035 [Planctomycetia bacterium]|nr:hypothetical protein [Planctomycetia bacterium]